MKYKVKFKMLKLADYNKLLLLPFTKKNNTI